MSYKIVLQTNYPNVAYQDKQGRPSGATIKSGGCGPASWANALNNLLGLGLKLPEVCKLSTQCGARYDGGTDVLTLGKALSAKHGGFELYKTTNDDEVIKAVRDKGAVAVCHTPAGANLFSDGGHFVALLDVEGKSTAVIADSYQYSGKYAKNSLRRKAIHTTSQSGIVKVGTSYLRKAIDYYIVVVKEEKKQTFEKWDGRDVDYKDGIDVVVTSENGIKLREGAGKDKPVIKILPQGTKGRCFGAYSKAEDGDLWWLTKFGDVKGYAHADWIGFV